MNDPNRDGAPAPPTTDGETSVCAVCDRFEPQAWRKTMCKNCFHTKNEHGGVRDTGGGEVGSGGGGKGGGGEGVRGKGGGGGGSHENSGVVSRKSDRVGPTGSHEKKAASADCVTPATGSTIDATLAAAEQRVTSDVKLARKRAISSADTKTSTTKAYVSGTAATASTKSSATTTGNTMTATTTTTTKTASDSKTTTPATGTSTTTSSKQGTQSDGGYVAPSKTSAVAAAAAALSSSTSKTSTDTKKAPPASIKISNSSASAKKLAEKFGGLKTAPKDVPPPIRTGASKFQLTPKSPATKDSTSTTGISTTTTTSASTSGSTIGKVSTTTTTTPTLNPTKTASTTLTSKLPEVKNSTSVSQSSKTSTESVASSSVSNNAKNDEKLLPKKHEEPASKTGDKISSEQNTRANGKSTSEHGVSLAGGVASNSKLKTIDSDSSTLKKFGGPPSPSVSSTQAPPQLKVTTGRGSLTPTSPVSTPSPSTNGTSSLLSTQKPSTSSSSSTTTTTSSSASSSSTAAAPSSSSSSLSSSSKTSTSVNKTIPTPQAATPSRTTTSTTTPVTKSPGVSLPSTKATPTTATTTTPATPVSLSATTKTPIAKTTTSTPTTPTTTNMRKAEEIASAGVTAKPMRVSVAEAVVAAAAAKPESTTNIKSKENTTKTPVALASDKSTPYKSYTTSTEDKTPKHATTPTTTTTTTTTTTRITPPSSLAVSATKMKATPPATLGDKYLGQDTDTSTNASPKVKTMVVESSKFAKSQAAAAAAAAAATTANQGSVSEYKKPGEEFGQNPGYMRQTSSTRLQEDPNKMSSYAITHPIEVQTDGQPYGGPHSYQGSNVSWKSAPIQDGGAEYDAGGYGRNVGEYSRQCSSSSTSSNSSEGKGRTPIVVEVQVRRGQRPAQQSTPSGGRSPSPAPAFMVLSPQGNNRLMRSNSSGFRAVSGFPSGRTSPVVFGPGGMYGGSMIDDGGGSERSWDSGGSCYSPSPSSCSSPVSSSMRSVYRPSPSPSPTPGSGLRVIPLPVLHTTSAAMGASGAGSGGGSSEYGVSRSATASPFTAGYSTPPPGYNTPPPPYSPTVDPASSGTQWKGANYPTQQFTAPHNHASSSGGVGSVARPNYYSADVPLNATNTSNVNKATNRAFDYNNSQDLDARDGRPIEQFNQQPAPTVTGYRKKDDIDARFVSDKGYTGTAYPGKNEELSHHPRVNNDTGDGVSGYQQKAKQQHAADYLRCHSDESAPDISERGTVSRHPGREDNTANSSADAVVSSGSLAAVSAVAQPPVSISNAAKEEGSSVKTTREKNRDQGPKEQKNEFPDQPGSKSDRRGSSSSAESLSPEPDRGLSSKERLNFRIQISELEDKVYKLERKNSKIQKEFGEKLALEKIIGELKNQLRSMERKYSGLEEEKKELEDQIQIEKVKVTKGQLESRSLMELRKLLEESDQARMKLTEENELLREEVNEMKVEIDEMYDQFRESEAEDFRELQKELEITAKNCRILQFKLRKAERRNEQVEADREQYEEKLRTLQNAFENEDARRHIQALEDEVKMAKEVSVRLHDELDILEEKRARVEDDNRKLQDMLELSDKKNFRMEMEIDKLRDKVSELQGSLAKAIANNDDSPNKKV